eukprot:403336582
MSQQSQEQNDLINQPDIIKTGLMLKDRFILTRLLGSGAYGSVWDALDSSLKTKFQDEKIYKIEKNIFKIILNKSNTCNNLLDFYLNVGLSQMIDSGFININQPSILNNENLDMNQDKRKRKVDDMKKPTQQISRDSSQSQSEQLLGDKIYYIIMNKLGNSLQQVLNSQRDMLVPKTILQIGIQLIKCIEHYHLSGFAHLDIKPDNILLNSNDYENAESSLLSLIDFSVSLPFAHKQVPRSQIKLSRDFNGNLAFSSKEQMMGLRIFRTLLVYTENLQLHEKPDYDYYVSEIIKVYPRTLNKGIDWVMDWSQTSLNWYNSFYKLKSVFKRIVDVSDMKGCKSLENGRLGNQSSMDMRTQSQNIHNSIMSQDLKNLISPQMCAQKQDKRSNQEDQNNSLVRFGGKPSTTKSVTALTLCQDSSKNKASNSNLIKYHFIKPSGENINQKGSNLNKPSQQHNNQDSINSLFENKQSAQASHLYNSNRSIDRLELIQQNNLTNKNSMIRDMTNERPLINSFLQNIQRTQDPFKINQEQQLLQVPSPKQREESSQDIRRLNFIHTKISSNIVYNLSTTKQRVIVNRLRDQSEFAKDSDCSFGLEQNSFCSQLILKLSNSNKNSCVNNSGRRSIKQQKQQLLDDSMSNIKVINSLENSAENKQGKFSFHNYSSNLLEIAQNSNDSSSHNRLLLSKDIQNNHKEQLNLREFVIKSSDPSNSNLNISRDYNSIQQEQQFALKIEKQSSVAQSAINNLQNSLNQNRSKSYNPRGALNSQQQQHIKRQPPISPCFNVLRESGDVNKKAEGRSIQNKNKIEIMSPPSIEDKLQLKQYNAGNTRKQNSSINESSISGSENEGNLDYCDIDEGLFSIEKLRIKYNCYLQEGEKKSNYAKLKQRVLNK